MKTVVAHGTFDILHYGHINYLEKAKSYGDYLIVLVSSDKICNNDGKNNFFDENYRIKVIQSLKCVDKVIIRNEDFSEELLKSLNTDILVTIYNDLQKFKNICDVEVVNRTDNVSTTSIKKFLATKKSEKKYIL